MGWVLAIDFGTSSTAAAAARDGGAQLVALDGGLPRMLSNVFLQESTGRLLLGDVADNAAVVAPWCLERAPKVRMGQEFMWLGEQRVRVADVVGHVLRRVADDATRLQGGDAPGSVRLTHPVRWGEERRARLLKSAEVAGLPEPELVLEPVAAAMHYARLQLEAGEFVAVYDLGGGTFDTALLQRRNGDFRVVGTPGGREDIGGEAFDDRLYEYLGQQLPEEQWLALRSQSGEGGDNTWPRANRQFQRNIRRAKELLTHNPQVDVLVPSPVNRDLPLTARELGNLIRRDIEQTVAELERTIRSASLTSSELSGIYLAGGSSQIPLVAEMIEQRLGVSPRYLNDPKAVICLGAALRALDQPARRPPEPPAVAPGVTRQPELVGRPQVGQALEVAAFNFSGTEPLSIAYHWQRHDATGAETYIPGANQPRLGLASEHADAHIRLVVTATNPAGTATSASPWTGPVTRGHPGHFQPITPSIPGTPTVPPGNYGQPVAPGVFFSPRTSRKAIVSLVLSLLWLFGLGSIVAIVLGRQARKSIARSAGHEGGQTLALVGEIFGWLGIAGMILIIVAAILGGHNTNTNTGY